MATPDTRNKEDAVIEECFSQGLALAIRDSLKSLFSEPRLPDNPYYYLASALGAYVDENVLWNEPDVSLVSLFDNEGGLEVADPVTKLCKLASSSNVWGLPHVLRCISKEGVKVVHDVLTNSMPDSFFPGPMPFSNKDGYTLQVLASVQGSTALWRPQWMEFPELLVRCDVVVRGPRLDEALGQLAGLLVDDLRELDAVPVFFVEGLKLVDPLGAALFATKAQNVGNKTLSATTAGMAAGIAGAAAGPAAEGAGGGGGAAGEAWTLASIQARPDDFRKALSRGVLAGKNWEMRAVLMVEAPTDAEHLQERTLRFEVALKRYCFHFWLTPDPTTAASTEGATQPTAAYGGLFSSDKAKSATTYSSKALQDEVAHYGSAPYEALFEGYYLDPASAKQYVALFQSQHKGPYSQTSLQANVDLLGALVERDMIQGHTLEGFRRLLLLVLLQDPGPVGPGPLTTKGLAPLEDLLSKTPNGESDLFLSTVPNLLRMLNSGAGVIQGVVREMEAVKAVSDAWPARKESCIAQATAAAEAAGLSPVARVGSPAAVPGTSSEESGPAATLAWLATFNMEQKVLRQLISLKPRVTAATGSGIFSGISVITSQLLAKLPGHAPESPAECAAVLLESRSTVLALQQLLEAASLTLADSLLERCRDVMWAMHRFGVTLIDSVMARAALVTDEGEVPPEWVLHVGAVTDAQIRSGAVAERVATEGIMLQYAVDTKLDTLLSSIYSSVTQPPLPLNPCRRLLHFLRAHAARLDLWKDDIEAVCAQLLNQLVLLAPPSFIYAAKPPVAATRAARAGRQHRPGGGVDDNDEEQATVYGSYAAVTLCDCRSLQSIAASLGGLLSERHWQQGSYSADVVPALVGDACVSGALGLSEAAEIAGPTARTRGAGTAAAATAQRSVSEHPRFYQILIEEHHQLAGPDLQQAAALWGAGVIDYVLELHQRSQHIVHQVVVSDSSFSVLDVQTATGKQKLVSALLQSVHAAVSQHPSTFPDDAIAVLELMAAIKEGLYVKVAKYLHFNYRKEGLPMDTTSIAAAAHRWGSAQQPGFVLPASGTRITSATDTSQPVPAARNQSSSPAGATLLSRQESVEPHWGLGVYQRVFLSESAAKAWYSWNCMRGDPAQPFHYQHLVKQVQQQIIDLEESGGLLDAQKLLLTAATAMQDVEIIFNVSRAMQSAAQELRCLQEINGVLQLLLSDALPPQQRAKLDTERLRHLFLMYCGRLRRAMTSPKYCYFTGFAAVAPRLIAELKEQVLGNFKLTARHAEILKQLNLWTLCCESSVASSIQDCFDEGIKHQLTQRLEIVDEFY